MRGATQPYLYILSTWCEMLISEMYVLLAHSSYTSSPHASKLKHSFKASQSSSLGHVLNLTQIKTFFLNL